MSMIVECIFFLVFWTIGVFGQNNESFEDNCTALGSLQLPNATIWFSQYVPAGTNLSFADSDPTCQASGYAFQAVSVSLCRIALYVATSNRSGISMETWLPSNWTGRFLSTGNGGLNGCIPYNDMAYTTGLGFATVGANNGHNGTSGEAFLNNSEVVTDFAWRSIHTNVVVGKEITNEFYKKPYSKSYYLGCSTGGRQGFKSAQSFPSDFDGIVAGAPAVAFNNLTSWSGHFYLATGPANSSAFIPLDLWPTIHQDILNQCDGIDGALDGIIENPLLCTYDPKTLLQNGTLTQSQVDAVRRIFAPLYDGDGSLVYPPMQPGSELNGAPQIFYNGQPFQYTRDWFGYAIYNNPNWDPATINPNDYDFAYRKNPADIESWSDLTAFQASGGKILHYHGLADNIISSDNSPRYYEYLLRAMNATPSTFDPFYRFFRISGMAHCSGGQGAWIIGQRAGATVDPNGNVLTAMVRWVENGVAPDTIEGIKYVDDDPTKAVQIARRHCRYPLSNVYVGPEDPSNPKAWKCVAQAKEKLPSWLYQGG
ncbi:MAG: Tannase and feruloyl esterase [Bogoriella megaspora]|nr:MAG: Tannase and feruloyl esterase [Bogoriella megaspora]